MFLDFHKFRASFSRFSYVSFPKSLYLGAPWCMLFSYTPGQMVGESGGELYPWARGGGTRWGIVIMAITPTMNRSRPRLWTATTTSPLGRWWGYKVENYNDEDNTDYKQIAAAVVDRDHDRNRECGRDKVAVAVAAVLCSRSWSRLTLWLQINFNTYLCISVQTNTIGHHPKVFPGDPPSTGRNISRPSVNLATKIKTATPNVAKLFY